MTKVRFAPSPTGKLHLGSARTAVFNWLYARHTKGKLILRIEDTDLSRSEEAYTDSIIRDMKWMGMDYDEFYKQSDRFHVYKTYIDRLLMDGKAYYCDCSREDVAARNTAKGADETTKYDCHCRGRAEKPSKDYVVRLNIGQDRFISFPDIVKGKITVNTKELDDYVILKSDGSPTYNFAVVIDDATMDVTHIIRGEDHITNTTKQIILYEYLGFSVPSFAHLPLVMGKDKSPLSKRKGSTNIEYYRAMGILPEALLNAIARLGWSHGNDEVFTIGQLIEYFDITKLNRSNAVYDEEKMLWVNGKHLKTIPVDKLSQHFSEFLEEAKLEKKGKMLDENWFNYALSVFKSRHNTLQGVYDEMLYYSQNAYTLEDQAKIVLDELNTSDTIRSSYPQARDLILQQKDFDSSEPLASELRAIADKAAVKFGDLIQVLRIRLTGRTATPDIIAVLKLLGDEVLKRI